MASFGVEFALVVSAEAWIGGPQMVVIINMLYLNDPREFDVVHLLSREQVQLPNPLHALYQLITLLEALRVGLDRLQHGSLQVGVFLLLVEQTIHVVRLPVFALAGGFVAESRVVGFDEVVAGGPALPGLSH